MGRGALLKIINRHKLETNCTCVDDLLPSLLAYTHDQMELYVDPPK